MIAMKCLRAKKGEYHGSSTFGTVTVSETESSKVCLELPAGF